ncbi:MULTISPECIES: Rid family hydrolase [Micromonospora]|uniref:Enamine deaminase RidA, house cleaning of reactive enamine intermediates, YjgF/YER057c/UK114 family n=1 Tax=Micromonospora yangpuensis TaxID=683228 RepID=A0A1C6UKS5_9ACTN|nr:Rid family hydrolase [Micromonospora yangpuensis]GGM17371.1 hypothetical protein GCM10012279_39360 [Micromonospora yangpuensis]SCL54665.1 Enamine deaminase RidA, house cleaning of reactive enamine intermediates, YjgF/YER057c/UK114 family [Micromonospora yangpuensis]
MTEPQFFTTAGIGEWMLENRHYHQAVRIGDRVDISGQGGWDDEITFPEALEDEIARTFDNVERALATAGATLRDVVSVDSFHVADAPGVIDEAHGRFMVEQFRKRMGDRSPVWTMIGVAALAAPGMRVEIRVTAVVGQAGPS